MTEHRKYLQSIYIVLLCLFIQGTWESADSLGQGVGSGAGGTESQDPSSKSVGKLGFSHLVMSDSATPWTVAHQALDVHRISHARILSGLPFPSPGHLPNPGILFLFPWLLPGMRGS